MLIIRLSRTSQESSVSSKVEFKRTHRDRQNNRFTLTSRIDSGWRYIDILQYRYRNFEGIWIDTLTTPIPDYMVSRFFYGMLEVLSTSDVCSNHLYIPKIFMLLLSLKHGVCQIFQIVRLYPLVTLCIVMIEIFKVLVSFWLFLILSVLSKLDLLLTLSVYFLRFIHTYLLSFVLCMFPLL